MTQGLQHRALADVIGAALVAKQVAVATDASGLSPRIPPDRGGSRAGYQHNGGSVPDCLQRQIHIRAYADQFPGKFLFEQHLHFSPGLRIRRSGKPRAK